LATCPEQVPFLQPGHITEYANFCGIAAKHLPSLQAAAQRMRSDPTLTTLCWHCHRQTFLMHHPGRFDDWLDFEETWADLTAPFYLLVSLSIAPLLAKHHEKLGIPAEVTRQTAQQVACFCANHERGNAGIPGIYRNQLSWLHHYVHKDYFRLGRMEYWLKPFHGKIRAFRHHHTQEVVALAEPGIVFDEHGFIRAEVDMYSLPPGSWVSSLEATPAYVRGELISPLGMALRKRVRLALNDWEPVLDKFTWVLDMHIPAGGGLTPEACLASHFQASAFFDRHYPARRWAAIACNSWMFNTQLEQILAPSTNLVKYMKDLYLFPVLSSGQDGLWFIFLQEPLNLNTAPAVTSLQRTVLDFLRAGNRWRGGGMFIMREHVAAIGSKHYRSNWAALEARVTGAQA